MMTYNSETGGMVCCAPGGEVVLRITEPNFKKAYAIHTAIQEAYKNGERVGRMLLHAEIMRFMGVKNDGKRIDSAGSEAD